LKLIILGTFVLLLLSVGVQAFDEEVIIAINDTQLPYNDSELMELGLEHNYSLYLEQYMFDSRANLSFPEEYFYNNTNTSNFSITYSAIDFFMNESVNFTVALNLTSDHPSFNDSFLLGFTFLINYTNQSTINETEVDIIYFGDSGYNIDISQNLLPREGTLDFNIIGNVGTTSNITYCDSWLTCPANITFINETETLSINYYIPTDTAVGTYVRLFNVTSGNITRSGNITFNIIESELIIEEYIWHDYCFEDEDSLLDCIREKESFDRQRLSDIYALALRKAENSTEYIYNETEVMVMVGSIDDEIKMLYDSCNLARSDAQDLYLDMSDKYHNCDSTLQTYVDERDTFAESVRLQEEGLEDGYDELNATATARQEELDKQFNRTIYLCIAAVIFVAACIWYWRKYKELNHTDMW